MFKTFLKVLLFIFGMCFIILGIDSIIVTANGGSFVTGSFGRYTSSGEHSGASGMLYAIFLTLMGVWMVSSVWKKKTAEDVHENKQKTVETEFCTWWQTDGEWHYEHNPIRRKEYPATDYCPECGKKIRVVEVWRRN